MNGLLLFHLVVQCLIVKPVPLKCCCLYMQKAGHYLDSLAAGIDMPLEEEELYADQLKEYLFYAGALQAVCRRQEMLQLQLEKAEAHVASCITGKDNVEKGEQMCRVIIVPVARSS